MQKLQFYRVEDFQSENPYLISSGNTLLELNQKIKEEYGHDKYCIFYHWKPLPLDKYGKLKLKEIVEEDPQEFPIFYVCGEIENMDLGPYGQKYSEGISLHQKTEENQKDYWVGQNGHVLFDDRRTAIMSSSVEHATDQEDYQRRKNMVIEDFKSSIITEEQQKYEKPEVGLVRRMLASLGIIKREPTSENIMSTIQTIKKIDTTEKLKGHIDPEYSDYDPKFATYLQAIYIKFAILSACKLHYVEYKTMEQGIIKYQFPSNCKVGIIGDYGTGLSDSIALLRDLIINKEADIILHLGDVYYAGTPSEYQNHVMKPLRELRKQSQLKFKKDVLFYSIPGNHDYYSWGLPYLCFIASANDDKICKQQCSYFCLRSEDQKWQFLGLDTAYHDSNPMNQINGFSIGPNLRHRQVQWFKNKMESFLGSTILLTHHQLYSIHDRLCGSLTRCREFSCVNPLLSAQLFEYLPYISSWYWGHEHSFMIFDNYVMGVPKCRLLGNSSFHVINKEGPYERKPGFPHIPFIEQDEEYAKKYLPINPNGESLQYYYNLCYALIDFSKQENMPALSPHSSSLNVEYYCCPCFPESTAQKMKFFDPYLLYSQKIYPRIGPNYVPSGQEAEEERRMLENFQPICHGMKIQIKTEIGLFASKGRTLNIAGIHYKIIVEQNKEVASEQLKNMVLDQSIVRFEQVAQGQVQKKPSKVLKKQSSSQQQRKLEKEEKLLEAEPYITTFKFEIKKIRVFNDISVAIRIGDAFVLKNIVTGEYLCCQIDLIGAKLSLAKHSNEADACKFMFVKESKIIM